jgi:hypothetical protein
VNTNEFFENLWHDYIDITPQAEKVRRLFLSRGDDVVNDHVAFRTFSDSPVCLAKLEIELEKMGYAAYENYRFEQKKLDARSYYHPADENAPKIFLSELQVGELSEQARAIISGMTAQISPDAVKDPSIFWQGRLWDMPTRQDYDRLLQESEYAAWLSTIGLRVNHFTVDVNRLNSLDDLQAVNQLLKDNGFSINTVGSEIKGSPELFLEQSSTMADKIDVEFRDGEACTIPSCFYEFAKRHQTDSGDIFPGFIEGNADKIFESTHAR